MQLHGLHHVTAVTRNASRNLKFYTEILGLRLVKKTVNQDDVSAYHLFYADKLGTPGTDMTFFDWPQTPPDQRGTDSIVNTMFRVNGRVALEYWAERLTAKGVTHQGIDAFNGRARLRFFDPEGQRLTLVDDAGQPFEGEVWDRVDVPLEYAIRGFFGIALSVPDFDQASLFLRVILNMSKAAQFPHPEQPDQKVGIFIMEGGGAGKEVHVYEQPNLRRARLGHGGVHHVAFRVKDATEQDAWEKHLAQLGVPSSGLIDRFYFKSLYFRISNGILFELATDGPGFAADENPETLGERLALPPFLEPQRAQIEAGLKPL